MLLRLVSRTAPRLRAPWIRLCSTSSSSSSAPPTPPDENISRLRGYMTLEEGKSWVTMLPHRNPPKSLSDLRSRARKLRLSGHVRAAHTLFRNAGAHMSRDSADLLEYLLVLLKTDEFKRPRERLQFMMSTLRESPAYKPKAAYNIMLTACAKEAALVSDNSSVKRDGILKTAHVVWNELLQGGKAPDPKNVALMYRVLGHCKDLDAARRIREHVNDPVLYDKVASRREGQHSGNVPSLKKSTKDATAAYILCLGECGRALEAEQLYFSPRSDHLRTSDRVLRALFLAYVAANRISKAESLIAMHGSTFLSVQSCNAFIKKCASLRMHETALNFTDRMSRSQATGFPQPNARTYNLLLRGLSAGTGAEDRDVAADRALAVVEKMKMQGIRPTTVTYNTLIRSFVLRDQVHEAFDLYRGMEAPNRITFSHLMQGAANIGDLELANTVFASLVKVEERPNYGFCKSYLEVVAKVNGAKAAFSEAKRISKRLGEVLVFDDVSSQEVIRMALISACGKIGNLTAAFDALRLELEQSDTNNGELAPLYVATVLMQVCLECNAPGRALEVFYSLKAANLKPNFEVYESLIFGLCSFVRSEGVQDGLQSGGDYPEEDGFSGHHDEAPRERSNKMGFRVEQSVDQKSFGSRQNDTWRNEATLGDFCRQEALQVAVEVLCEMHINGQGRAMRQAAYVYNSLIAAAAELGDFELALQVFNKMSVQNNRGVVYFSASHEKAEWPTRLIGGGRSSNRQEGLAALASTGIFESGFEFPAATVGTYNSVMDAARRCGEPWFAFEVFEMMQTSRITEPNTATLSLLADVALSESELVGVEGLTQVLKELDHVQILPKEVAKKRVRLRQKLLALRWSIV